MWPMTYKGNQMLATYLAIASLNLVPLLNILFCILQVLELVGYAFCN